MQNEIDQARRQCLIIKMLSCVLSNQIDGVPSKHDKLLSLQKSLLMEAAVESEQLSQSIEVLVQRRDSRG